VWLVAETLCPAPVAGGPGDTTPDLPVTEAWGALLAGQVLAENADLDDIAPRDFTKHQRIRDWQLALLRRRALPPFERALAGRSLSRLGDPRPEVMTLDGMQFCFVPAGPFWMGDDNDENAKPMHQVDLPAYWIGRYPVTTAQWREYVRESGRQPEDNDSQGGDGNAPAIWVNWGEALAFCDWLSARWAAQLPAGWRVALPSEAEWEKAARGGAQHLAHPWLATVSALRTHDGLSMIANSAPRRHYPWGDDWDAECANTGDTLATQDTRQSPHIGRVSAVGTFPSGRSPCGTEELAGNVWEWTRSLWGTDVKTPAFGYPYPDALPQREDPSAGPEALRVVRGGGWYVPRFAARCAYRFRGHPDGRYFGLGFRVVLCCSPVR
jgi:formylglycine-generating enzyme required for sulfatase activity